MYRGPQGGARASDNLLAVAYSASAAKVDGLIRSRAASLGARSAGALYFDRIGRNVRVVGVAGGQLESAKAQLRSIPGVVAVSDVHRAYAQAKGATLTNDPYFAGFSGTGPPLYQTDATGGQWDMHIVQLEHAFSYSEGSTSVKLAIIDTGEDVTHPDLAPDDVVRAQCFITSEDGSRQSRGTFVTDPDGHGTDVTGIAAAAVNTKYGFAGDAGHVALMLYRVFPTPDDNCSNPKSTDRQCGTSTIDIASAINDAVSNGANVISISLGTDRSTCANGVDPDTLEGSAVANAIAQNVIVVAASGNDNGAPVTPPACDSGVIAVGSSAYNDGQPNASGFTGARTEYVPSYANYGSANALRSASSWGIVAPGGDGDSSAQTIHYLQWIENIWTTTPFDLTFAGTCGTDSFGGANDCRILIAGTSMATPHVAGAAALILSVNRSAYGSPLAMRRLLCSTADDIGDAHQGCGRLNVYRAVSIASGDPNPPPF